MEEMSSQLDLLLVNPSGRKQIRHERANEMTAAEPA
jgi:hypothetical protein